MSRNFELLKRAEQERLARPLATAVELVEAPHPSRPLPSESRRAASLCIQDASRPENSVGMEPEITKLVQNLFVLNSIAPPRVVLFSSAARASEPVFVATRVGECLSDQKLGMVCVVDADVRHAAIHAYFGVDNTAGFTTFLFEEVPLHRVAHGVPSSNLTVLTSGPWNVGWPNQFASDRTSDRLRELRNEFDFVLVNAPPITEMPSIAALGQRVDGAVLIIEANETKRDVAMRAKREWQRANTRLLGVVLNNRTFPIPPAVYARL